MIKGRYDTLINAEWPMNKTTKVIKVRPQF